MLPIFVSALSDPSYILDNDTLEPITKWFGIYTSYHLLVYGGVGLISIFTIKGIYIVFLDYVKSKFVYNRYSLMSSNLFMAYLSAPFTFHLSNNSAELIRNVTTETRFISNHIMMTFLSICMEVITVFGIFFVLVFVEPIITLYSVLFIGLSAGILLKVIKKKLSYYGNSAAKERAQIIKEVNEGIGGFKDIKLNGRSNYFMQRFKRSINDLTKAEIFKHIASSIAKPVVELVAVISMFGIAIFMLWQGREMTSIIPVLTLFAASAVRLIPSGNKIITDINKLRFNIFAVEPVYNHLKLLDKGDGEMKKNSLKITLNDSIQLNNVSFKYPNTSEYSIRDINIKIKKGSSVALVGESGAGKSTLINIILGLLQPTEGSVKVDDNEIGENIEGWQRNIGYIPQNIYLSDTTIKQNIAFGIEEDDISEEKVENAIEASQLKPLIRQLPKGFNTIIGENGVRLSGGQRQRIGIARALYNEPVVLVMDEATSALDTKTEKEIIKSVEKLKGERTLIMVAHRISTVRKCDTLYVLDGGKLINKGNYEELNLKSNKFKEINQ